MLSSERRRVLAALFTFAPAEPVDDCKRRLEAIRAVAALCKRQELSLQKVCRTKIACYNNRAAKGPIAGMSVKDRKVKDDIFPLKCLPTQCIFCIGKEEMSFANRTKTFRDRGGLKRHFYRKHL